MIRSATILRTAGVLLCACILCLVLPGCRDREQQTSPNNLRGGVPDFSIGIVPEQNIFRQQERYEPLARYLSRKTGLRIRLHVLAGYENALDKINAGELDAAFLGSFTGAAAIKTAAAHPLARPQYPDGTSTYHGLLFTRKNSGIHTARDMQGRTFAFVDRATTAGWLLPLHYFKEHGINDPAAWLGEIYFTGTHEDAVMDVINGKADVGAAKNTVFAALAQADARIATELTILARSPPVPENGLLVRRDTVESIRTKLQQVLLGMHLDMDGRSALDVLGVTKFIETTARDYDPVFDYAEDIGLDLATGSGPDHW